MRSILFRIRWAALATIAFAVVGGPALTLQTRAEAPVADHRASAHATTSVDPALLFDAVVDTIKSKFVDTERLRALNWEARANEVRPSVVSATTIDEAVGIIRQLLAELRLSHTELMTPDEARYYDTLDMFSDYSQIERFSRERFWGSNPYYAGIGVFTVHVEGKYFVDGVLEGSPADKAGLKFGDEIVAVDGKPYTTIAAFRGKIGTDAEITIRRLRGGDVTRYRVPIVPVVPSAAFADATRSSARIIERDGLRVGYIHIWSLKESGSFHAALANLDPQLASRTPPTAQPDPQTATLDALIIDMRGRIGGQSAVANQILETVSGGQRPNLEPGAKARPDAPPARSTISRRVEAAIRPFKGKSVLLVNHQTRSAGEVLAYGYKKSSIGWVFGSQTATAVVGSNAFVMPGGYLLLVPVLLLEFGGKPLEGTGVVPDIRVERPLPYADGADPVLDAALKHLATGSGLPHPASDLGVKQ